jgi:RHH-type proline utilization regulon transcriptional repressor/proline dehydrogenase/delta 1-pyrroline-5-carboxylate dehydrogenase
MIADSAALPEQAVRDILASAFQSAWQRCSVLRILYPQSDVEAAILEMLPGAMDGLRLGDPWNLATDIGPVIDRQACDDIKAHCAWDETHTSREFVTKYEANSRQLLCC